VTPGARSRRRLALPGRPAAGGAALTPDDEERPVNGWLMWGLILPLLLVVAGIVTIRRRNHRS
jgi:hypothetical protein